MGLVLPHSMDVVTGTLAGPLIRECADALMQKYPQVKITVHEIKNEYFGGNVSVRALSRAPTSSSSAAAGCTVTCWPCPRS